MSCAALSVVSFQVMWKGAGSGVISYNAFLMDHLLVLQRGLNDLFFKGSLNNHTSKALIYAHAFITYLSFNLFFEDVSYLRGSSWPISTSAAPAVTSPLRRVIQINLVSYSARHGSDYRLWPCPFNRIWCVGNNLRPPVLDVRWLTVTLIQTATYFVTLEDAAFDLHSFSEDSGSSKVKCPRPPSWTAAKFEVAKKTTWTH